MLISGPYLIVITKRVKVGEINNCTIWQITGTQMYPFAKNMNHITEQQVKELLTQIHTFTIGPKDKLGNFEDIGNNTIQGLSQKSVPIVCLVFFFHSPSFQPRFPLTSCHQWASSIISSLQNPKIPCE